MPSPLLTVLVNRDLLAPHTITGHVRPNSSHLINVSRRVETFKRPTSGRWQQALQLQQCGSGHVCCKTRGEATLVGCSICQSNVALPRVRSISKGPQTARAEVKAATSAMHCEEYQLMSYVLRRIGSPTAESAVNSQFNYLQVKKKIKHNSLGRLDSRESVVCMRSWKYNSIQ